VEQWERKQAGPVRRSPVAKGTARGVPDPVPWLTPEQVQHEAKLLCTALVLLVDALDREAWDGRWTNRLMHAHTFGRNALENAAKTKPVAGLNAEDASDAAAGVGETTAVEASQNNANPGR
jgi:hypothetical protein